MAKYEGLFTLSNSGYGRLIRYRVVFCRSVEVRINESPVEMAIIQLRGHTFESAEDLPCRPNGLEHAVLLPWGGAFCSNPKASRRQVTLFRCTITRISVAPPGCAPSLPHHPSPHQCTPKAITSVLLAGGTSYSTHSEKQPSNSKQPQSLTWIPTTSTRWRRMRRRGWRGIFGVCRGRVLMLARWICPRGSVRTLQRDWRGWGLTSSSLVSWCAAQVGMAASGGLVMRQAAGNRPRVLRESQRLFCVASAWSRSSASCV